MMEIIVVWAIFGTFVVLLDGFSDQQKLIQESFISCIKVYTTIGGPIYFIIVLVVFSIFLLARLSRLILKFCSRFK